MPDFTVNLAVPTFGAVPAAGWRSLLDLARTVEDAGIDRLVVTDHVVNGPEVASYPWGRFPTGPEADWLEPLTVLTAMAAVTERIRLGTGILVVPLRPAAVLAKSVATLDVISGGRVDLGVGTGWQRAEFEAIGVDFEARGRLLTDTVAACRALWQGGPTDFESQTTSLSQVYCAPVPLQERLPVWFSGALHRRNLERIVTLGDGWIPIMGSTHDQVAEGARHLQRAFAEAGRTDRPGVRLALSPRRGEDGRPDVRGCLDGVPALLEAGVTELHFNLMSLDPQRVDPAAACAALVDAVQPLRG